MFKPTLKQGWINKRQMYLGEVGPIDKLALNTSTRANYTSTIRKFLTAQMELSFAFNVEAGRRIARSTSLPVEASRRETVLIKCAQTRI